MGPKAVRYDRTRWKSGKAQLCAAVSQRVTRGRPRFQEGRFGCRAAGVSK